MYRLQKFWLRTIYSLLLLLSSFEALSAAEQIMLYSSLGEPLVAEVPLKRAEQGVEDFVVEATEGGEWRVIAIEQRDALLLLSEQKIDSPIFEFDLRIAGQPKGRPITIFLNPHTENGSITYLGDLVLERNRALQGFQDSEQRLQQLQQQWDRQQQHSLLGWLALPQGQVFSAWTLFLLLGGAVALLLFFYWRSADSLELSTTTEGAHSYNKVDVDEVSPADFQRAVEAVEGRIEKIRDSDSPGKRP